LFARKAEGPANTGVVFAGPDNAASGRMGRMPTVLIHSTDPELQVAERERSVSGAASCVVSTAVPDLAT